MMKIKSSLYCLTMLLTLTAQVAVARPSILAAWQSAYPASDSDLVNCQLCHQNTSGGNPWNAYGWNIRQGIQNSGLAASAAIAAIEGTTRMQASYLRVIILRKYLPIRSLGGQLGLSILFTLKTALH